MSLTKIEPVNEKGKMLDDFVIFQCSMSSDVLNIQSGYWLMLYSFNVSQDHVHPSPPSVSKFLPRNCVFCR